jgi:hypothetical protein
VTRRDRRDDQPEREQGQRPGEVEGQESESLAALKGILAKVASVLKPLQLTPDESTRLVEQMYENVLQMDLSLAGEADETRKSQVLAHIQNAIVRREGDRLVVEYTSIEPGASREEGDGAVRRAADQPEHPERPERFGERRERSDQQLRPEGANRPEQSEQPEPQTSETPVAASETAPVPARDGGSRPEARTEAPPAVRRPARPPRPRPARPAEQPTPADTHPSTASDSPAGAPDPAIETGDEG